MGTSGAFGGSGGKDWQRARDDVSDLVNSPDSAKQQQVISDLATALDWDAPDAPPAPDHDDGDRPADAPPVQRPFGRLVRPRGAADGPGGGGAGGGRGPGVATTTASGRGGSGRRSRQRVAGVGGAVLAAGLALRAGMPARSTRSDSRCPSCVPLDRSPSAIGSSTRSWAQARTSTRTRCAPPRAPR
jgi:hypothetical protein